MNTRQSVMPNLTRLKSARPGVRLLRAVTLIQGLLVQRGVGAQGVLENPQPASAHCGIGVISGFVCEATQVDMELNGTVALEAAYGTSRADTQTAFGDTDNGFGLLFNWNLLGSASVIPDGSPVYVPNFGSDTVSVINTVAATVLIGNGPRAFGKFISPAPLGGSSPLSILFSASRSH